MYSDAAAHKMLDAMDETASPVGYTHASLHSAYSATGAANELNGGSPAYARIGVVGAAAGSRAKVFTPASAFNVPPGSTVAWVGRWNALTVGTFWGMAPAGAGPRRQFNVSDAADVTANTIDSPTHGLSAGNRVCFWAAAGAALPAGGLGRTLPCSPLLGSRMKNRSSGRAAPRAPRPASTHRSRL